MYKGVGVIFMGGKASRLSGVSKADIRIGNRSCLERVQTVLASHFDTVALSVAKPTCQALPTILDWPSETGDGAVIFSVLAVLEWALDNDYDYVVTAPCDTPFLSADFAAQLVSKFDGTTPVVCASGGCTHNLHALWPAAKFEHLKAHVLEKGERKVGRIHELLGSVTINFEADPVDPFFNINRPDDLLQARSYAKEFKL